GRARRGTRPTGLPVCPRGGRPRRRLRPGPALRRRRAQGPAHLPRPLEQRLYSRSRLPPKHPRIPTPGRPGAPRRVRLPRSPGRPGGLQESHARRRGTPRMGPTPVRQL
ncbi:MAG: hypothetical protein AVDCRST_MAG02-4752, partial [uncultured Rubrobacteraceae bacterium]